MKDIDLMKQQDKKREKELKKELRAIKKAQKKRHRVLRAFLCGVVCTAAAIAVSAVVCASAAAVYIETHPELFKADLSLFALPTEYGAAELYYFPQGAKNGIEVPICDPSAALHLETLSGNTKMIYVPISEIPTELQNAFIAIEDKRFYTHRGVDLRRTGAAILNFLLKRDSSFGGSTITQQLIKNVTGEASKTPMRKVSEIFRALDLEKSLGKSEILEQYLNIISLANGCRGVGAASELYFGKTPAELTLSECASIAAITQNPSRYDPLRHPENNQTRRDNILREMYLQNYITEKDYRAAVATEVATVSADVTETVPEADENRHNSWYTDLVIEDVIDGLTERYGYTRAEASHLIYCGGLRIYTLIDPALQEALEAYYNDPSNFPRLENGKTPQSGMIVLDPQTGNILAVAGAIGEKSGDRIYNFATDAKRPPGSVLKPLSVYAPALEYGIAGYSSVYDDVPVEFTKRSDGSYSAWPRNASGIYRGLSSVDYAVSHSLNTVAVRILEEIGIDRSFDFLKNTLGIESLTDGKNGVTDRGTAALALGQMNYGATLREITAAYSVFSNGGVYRNARSYALVTDASGQILLDNKAVIRPAISEENAELMTKMLENVTTNGTARTLTLTNRVAAAGKTGTTQYSFDRWFVGYTPGLLAGVWYGYEYPETLSGLEGNPALSIWDGAMHTLYNSTSPVVRNGQEAFSYDRLRAVRVCADSGLLVSDACTLDPRGNRATVAYFTEGTVPTEFCSCHTIVPYSGTGADPSDGVVLDGSSAVGLRSVGLIRVNRAFPSDIYVSDAQYTAAPIASSVLPSDDPLRAYYANMLNAGTFVGKSYGARPFNRPCTKRRTERSAS